MAFPECPSICPVLSLRKYLVRTAPLHHADAFKMFIQQRKPHKSVSAQTLAQWMTNIMADASVDTSVLKQHSTRSASAAWLEISTKSMSVAQICKLAHWSALTTTYKKFYRRVVLHSGRQQKLFQWAGWRWDNMVVTICYFPIKNVIESFYW